ncbi:putative aldo/keto reductase [Colletotrichum sublineola]|uniref:Putative aldo/keto reductase n=1 Tax=Colletotrichum sublineola TaxID=1173701 RepID=A0A066XLC2_COLSU|nr:putative aldo/keto reductase [Colletotrichum sublineola]
MTLAQSFKLLSGYEIPAVSLGTWVSNDWWNEGDARLIRSESRSISKPSEVKNAVEHALKSGYHHIDAAAIYDNKKEVGEGVKAAGITSKLWNTHHKAKDVEIALDIALKDLQTDSVDLYLIHWPVSFKKKDDTTREKIEDLWKTAEIRPVVNQTEAHPYLQQPGLLAWCKEQGIVVEAYSPLANNIYNLPRAVDDPTIAELAKSLDKKLAQLLISWCLQRGTVVLPKSVTPSRIEKNFEVFEIP